jgi:hypothetical protein
MRLTCSSPRESSAFCRQRDAKVLWLLGQHPMTAAMLAGLGLFPNRRKALKRLSRLRRRGRLRLVGTVSRRSGRPEYVFACHRVKADQLLHEVELSDLCLRIDAAEIRRGPHVIDRRLRPDAELVINDRVYKLELDRGTMSYAQIDRRFRLYEGSNDFVLWVCRTPERADALRRRAGRVRGIALFTTFDAAAASPHADIWLDHGGGRARLPRQSRTMPSRSE